MPKELKTSWQNNKWMMYATENGNNPSLPNALIVIPDLSVVIKNPTYKKYKNKQVNNVKAAKDGRKRTLQHEPGYHRRIIAATLTLFIGLIGLSVSSTGIFTGESIIMAIIGLTISSPLFITGLFLSYSSLRIQDKFNREKEQFKVLEKLKKNIEHAYKEIKIKEQCINNIISWINNSAMKRNVNINHDIKQGLFGQIAENFDSKNDLNFYINISSTLNKFYKSKYSLNSIKFSENILIDYLIFELIKAEISINYYKPSLDKIFNKISENAEDIYELINLIQKNSTNLSTNNNEPQTFLFINLGENLVCTSLLYKCINSVFAKQ